MNEEEAAKKIKGIISRHLNSNDYRIFMFGSRASGSAGRYSDFDIGIQGKEEIPDNIKFLIEDELEESDIPFTVDIVDFSMVSENFKKVALSSTKEL